MSNSLFIATALLLMSFSSTASLSGDVQSPSSSSTEIKENGLTNHASGPFDVKLTPETLSEKSADPTLGRNDN